MYGAVIKVYTFDLMCMPQKIIQFCNVSTAVNSCVTKWIAFGSILLEPVLLHVLVASEIGITTSCKLNVKFTLVRSVVILN